MLDKDLLNVLVCPSCQGDLIEQDDQLVCQQCWLKYPIKDGIPALLIDEAKK